MIYHKVNNNRIPFINNQNICFYFRNYVDNLETLSTTKSVNGKN